MFDARKLLPAGLGLALPFLAGCRALPDSRPAAEAPPALRVHASRELLADPILEAFTRRSGIPVLRLPSDRPESVAEAIREGSPLDLALLPGELVPGLAADGLLARLDEVARLPGFVNVPLALRDLVHDPANRHSVPLAYGTTGLVVRLDRVAEIPARWADLWARSPAPLLAARDRARDLLGAALLAFGHPGDSEDPQALTEALRQILALAPPSPRLLPLDQPARQALGPGGAAILIGRAGDYLDARDAGLDVAFVLPREGALLWSEHLVLPAASPRQAAALAFVDFLLDEEISARIARDAHVATANSRAAGLLVPRLAADPLVYPLPAILAASRFQLPRTPAGELLYDAIWQELKTTLSRREARR